MQFTAKGFLSASGSKNTVEVECVEYWISGADVCRAAKAFGLQTEGLRTDEYGVDGREVLVTVHRDGYGVWAELAKN